MMGYYVNLLYLGGEIKCPDVRQNHSDEESEKENKINLQKESKEKEASRFKLIITDKEKTGSGGKKK